MRRLLRGDAVLYVVIGLASGLWMAPLLSGLSERVLMWRPALFSDLLVSHLPLSIFVHDSVVRWWQVPLWNPLWLGGQPLIADPLAGLLYPPHWLTFLFPTLAAYNMLLFAHLVWTGIGQVRLAQELGMSRLSALAAGLAWAGLPKLLGTVGLGHVTLLYAVSWTPWLLLVVHRAATAAGRGSGWIRASLRAGGVLGVIFLADPRWAAPSALLGAAYAAFVVLQGRRGRPGWLRTAAGAGLAAAVGGMLSAGLAVPLIEMIPHTTRAAIDPARAADLGASALDLLSLVFPNPLHWPEVNAAVGVVVLLLAVVAVLVRPRRRWFWAVAGLGFLVLAMGNAGGVYGLLAGLVPGAGLLRVPARFLLPFGLSAALLAGFGLEDLARGRITQAAQERARLGLVAFFCVPFGLLLGFTWLIGPQFITGRPGVAVAMLLTGVSAVLAMVAVGRGPDMRSLPAWFAALIVLELTVLNLSALEAREPDLSAPERFEAALTGRWGGGRAFSPTYSLPQAWAARAGVERADGVDPLMLSQYWRYMADAVGYNPEEYSVTLPPLPGGDPDLPRYGELDAARLGLLNVRWVVASHPVGDPRLEQTDRSGALRLYLNQAARPRAWVQDSLALDPDAAWTSAQVLAWSPNRIIVQAQGPGHLVLAQNAYRGWTARVGGAAVSPREAGDLLLAIELPEGENAVFLEYRPVSALIGLGFTFLGLLVLLGSELLL